MLEPSYSFSFDDDLKLSYAYEITMLDANISGSELLGGLFPRGKVSSLVAEGGVGKTFVLVASSLAVTSNQPFLPDSDSTNQLKVLLIDTEGRLREFVRRVDIFNGNRANYYTPKHPLEICTFSNETDRVVIEKTIVAKDIGLVIVDSFAGFSNVDENTNAVLPALQWLSSLALKYNTAIVFTQLVNKSENKNNRITTKSVRGFSGITQWCEMVWALDKPTADKTMRRLYQIKNNVTEEDPTDYLFKIQNNQILWQTTNNTTKHQRRFELMSNNPKLSNKEIAKLIQQEEPDMKLGSIEMWISRNRNKSN
jgi:RecA-family ATPase